MDVLASVNKAGAISFRYSYDTDIIEGEAYFTNNTASSRGGILLV